MTAEVAVVPQQNSVAVRDFMPVFDIAQALERRNAMVQFVQQIMVPEVDFGKIPGTSQKNVLLKPGAEKLCSFFGLSPEYILVSQIEDWTGADHGKEPFFYYLYRCRLSRNGRVMGEGDGSCNSWETKYRYRNGERKCPQCEKPTIIKGKAEYGGGFICFAKKGGCGAKFGDKEPAIIGQEVGRVPNPDIADVVNTVLKMSQKRALVQATLIAVNASDYFTQDIEDMHVIEVEHHEPPPQPKAQGKPKQQPQIEEAEIIPCEIPDELQAIYDLLAQKDQYIRLEVFKKLKAALVQALGNEGEMKYYDIFTHYNIKKSNEPMGLKTAQCAARDMYLAIRRAVDAQAKAKEPYVGTDEDVEGLFKEPEMAGRSYPD